MKKPGINLVGIKEYNRALIMQLICTSSYTTRNSLAKRSKLTSMTLTNITSELIQKGIIKELDIANQTKSVGRSPKVLVLASTSPVIAGIWMSKDFLFGIISDMTLNILSVKRVAFEARETGQSVMDKMVELIRHMLDCPDRTILGLGIATIGVVDTGSGAIKNVTDFYNIKELNIKDRLSREFDLPIFVRNDMQSSATCEMYYGMGKKKDDFIYVGITNGVGAAIVSNRRLLGDTTGFCGELGHMTIDYQGEQCSCGNRGCLELYASVPNLLNRINRECGASVKTMHNAMDLCAKNPEAMLILEDVCERMAYALNNLVNMVSINTIVLGHSGVLLPDSMLQSMKKRIDKINVFRNIQKVGIHKTQFLENSPLFGSVCIVLEQVFTGRLSL